MGLLEVLRLESSGVGDCSDSVETDIEADRRGREHGAEGAWFGINVIVGRSTSGASTQYY